MRRNLPYKILALFIALLAWYYANYGQNPISREYRAALEVTGVDSACVVSDAPKTVKISLRGQRRHIESIFEEADSIRAFVRLPGNRAGRYVVPVRVQIREDLKGSVRATPIPPEVAVSVAGKAEKAFPVEMQFVGPPPVGYRFGSPEIAPDRASATGASEKLADVSQLIVAVDPRGARGGIIDGDLPVLPRDRRGNVVRRVEVTPARVHVRLELLEAPASRIVYISPSLVGQPSFPFKVSRIDVSPETMAVAGRPDQLTSVSTLHTEPVILAGRTRSFTQRVRVIAPRGLALGEGRFVRLSVGIVSSNPPRRTGAQ